MGHRHVFESREPPRGGIEGLRARIETQRRAGATRARALWIGTAGAVATAAVLLVMKPGSLTPVASSAEPLPGSGDMVPALVALGLHQQPSESVSVPSGAKSTTAVQRVPVADADVVFYWVASAE